MIRKIGMFSFMLAAFIFVLLTMNMFDRLSANMLRKALWFCSTLGLILFSIHYLTQAPQDRKKKPFYAVFIHFFGLVLIALGLIFKIMHWPYSGFLLVAGFIVSGISFIVVKNELETSPDSDLIDSE
jgi:hypothetical protein